MKVPLVSSQDATLLIDPLNIYEQICRFTADVIFSGLMKRIAIEFKPEKDAPPFIPLSPALKAMTRVLNSDLRMKRQRVGLINQLKLFAPGFCPHVS